MALNHCMTDDLIETIWILAFFRYLETNTVSVGNLPNCIYPAINHCTSKSPEVFILKIANILWFPEPKAQKHWKLRMPPTSEQGIIEWAWVLQLHNCKMGVVNYFPICKDVYPYLLVLLVNCSRGLHEESLLTLTS